MKKFTCLLFISAFAVSCINLNGQLNVLQTMNVKKKGGFLHLKMKNVELSPGLYRAELKVNGEKSFTLKLRLDKENDEDILIPIKSDKAFNLPDNGAVKIAGSEISQPFDLNGTINTEISNSSVTRTYEPCTISRVENHCEKICRPDVDPRDPRRDPRHESVRCDVVCRDVVVSFNGLRDVDSHTRFTERNLKLDLKDIGSAAQLATLSASGTESERITDFYGECRFR